ncbi:MAG: arsenic resistance N-acetyltransferase ArsN2 [Gemmatimonadales bacterium]
MTTRGGLRPQAAVRAATAADYPGVVALLETAGLPVAGVTATLADFFVADDDGRIVGAVGLETYRPDGLLRSAVVDSDARGSGIGAALVERILGLARERGMRSVYLLTTTAERYFPRFGFEPVSRDAVADGVQASLEFREACPASAVAMRRTLA